MRSMVEGAEQQSVQRKKYANIHLRQFGRKGT